MLVTARGQGLGRGRCRKYLCRHGRSDQNGQQQQCDRFGRKLTHKEEHSPLRFPSGSGDLYSEFFGKAITDFLGQTIMYMTGAYFGRVDHDRGSGSSHRHDQPSERG